MIEKLYMEMKDMERFRHLLIRSALMLTLCILIMLAVSSLFVTARVGAIPGRDEYVLLANDSFPANVLLTAGMIGLLLIFKRCFSVRTVFVLAGIAAGCSFMFLMGTEIRQMYDAYSVAEAARLFSQGNYKAMTLDYFNTSSYQLGICLPMEIVMRLLPGIDINLFMQGLGVVFNALSVLMLALLTREITGDARLTAVVGILSACFLPAFLYPAHAYNTLPMLFCVTGAMLVYTRYVRTRKVCFGFLYAALLALAYMLKPNAAIAIIALGICAVFDAMESRSVKPVCFALLSAVSAVLLARAVIWQYELRSGINLTPDISMLARFAMGLQEGGAEAGWFNRYIEQFFPFEVTEQEERAVALADIIVRLKEMATDPAMTVDFFRRKLLSQWQEPTCGTLWIGRAGGQHGFLAGVTSEIYAQDSTVGLMLEGYMNIFQQALYLLSCAGLVKWIADRPKGVRLMLPVYVLGGILYHWLFEAKSQYAYIYLLMLMPLAAQGLCMIDDAYEKWKANRRG